MSEKRKAEDAIPSQRPELTSRKRTESHVRSDGDLRLSCEQTGSSGVWEEQRLSSDGGKRAQHSRPEKTGEDLEKDREKDSTFDPEEEENSNQQVYSYRNRKESRLVFDSGDSLCRYAIDLCLNEGIDSSPRGIKVRELQYPVVLTLSNVSAPFMTSKVRRPNYRFGLMEACWILSGSNSAQEIGRFNKQMLKFSDDEKTLWGAYGPRVVNQLPHVISTLKRDMDSRQAVITTWRPMEKQDDRPSDKVPIWDGASFRSRDVPCTVAWHFQVRNYKLNLTVLMRSNDVWLGLPYDLLSFTTVQRVVASALGIAPGEYNHVVSNMHLYLNNADKAASVANESRLKTVHVMPSMGTFFEYLNTEIISQTFQDLMHGAFNDYPPSPSLTPFIQANGSRPGLGHWLSEYNQLMRDNGR